MLSTRGTLIIALGAVFVFFVGIQVGGLLSRDSVQVTTSTLHTDAILAELRELRRQTQMAGLQPPRSRTDEASTPIQGAIGNTDSTPDAASTIQGRHDGNDDGDASESSQESLDESRKHGEYSEDPHPTDTFGTPLPDPFAGRSGKAVNGVYIYKIGPNEAEWKEIIASVCFLFNNVFKPNKANYPIVAFHEGDNFPAVRREAEAYANKIGVKINFVEIQIPDPDVDESKDYPYKGIQLSYRKMIEWRCILMFRHKALAPYDVGALIDTDFFFAGPMKYDPLRSMYDGGYDLGYWHRYTHALKPVATDTFEGVIPLIKEYAAKKFPHKVDIIEREYKITSGREKGRYRHKILYGCFVLLNLRFLRSKLYHDYSEVLRKAHGIYYRRWGDQAIFALAPYVLDDSVTDEKSYAKRVFHMKGSTVYHKARYTIPSQRGGTVQDGRGQWHRKTAQDFMRANNLPVYNCPKIHGYPNHKH